MLKIADGGRRRPAGWCARGAGDERTRTLKGDCRQRFNRWTGSRFVNDRRRLLEACIVHEEDRIRSAEIGDNVADCLVRQAPGRSARGLARGGRRFSGHESAKGWLRPNRYGVEF